MHLGDFYRIVIETYQQFGGLLLSLLQKDAEFIMSVFFVCNIRHCLRKSVIYVTAMVRKHWQKKINQLKCIVLVFGQVLISD